jgi:curved DNA-binding protein CbpA
MNDFKKDYYQLLDTVSSASADEIKLAYRKQVKKYHPDLHPGNSEYEELIKEINEAYEVLSNTDERFAYDQYLLNKKAQQKKQTSTQNPINKRTYTKTTTAYDEKRIYLKGTIFIKYFGKHDEREAENILREIDYKITATQTDAIIEHPFKQNLTKEFQEVFATNKPIKLNVKQPISCKVVNENKSVVDYQLEILDLTIPNPEIINVTKHEGESFGTITGTFYGYVKKDISYDINEEVTECFGETGITEQKNENGINYYRKEYYNTDCSRYWGNWIPEVVKRSTEATGKAWRGNYAGTEYDYNGNKNTYRGNWKQTKSVSSSNGCMGSFGSIIGIGISFLFFIFLLPQLAFLLPFILIPLLLNLLPIKLLNWIVRIAFVLFGTIFLLAIIASMIRYKKTEPIVVKPKPNMVKPKYTPILDSSSNQQIIDTLISHYMVWDDYNGKTYEGNFSVRKSALDQAHLYKETLNIPANSENNYDKIIFSLKENDKNNITGLYNMFDSLQLVNKPNAMAFAEIIVSFVQKIPYTLILPKACDSRLYKDEFILKYLSTPYARCEGFERYGINTPVEFMAKLNGDCDTRTLLLYTILSHYNYDVALLSSAHYGHSTIGINLPYEGKTFKYNNQRYVFWETTIENVKPGILSNEISNTDYWRISLKSK